VAVAVAPPATALPAVEVAALTIVSAVMSVFGIGELEGVFPGIEAEGCFYMAYCQHPNSGCYTFQPTVMLVQQDTHGESAVLKDIFIFK
jgi:hypothetical protein